MLVLFFVLLVPFKSVLAQVVLRGSCDEYVKNAQDNFDLERYMGFWHENSRYDTNILSGPDCVTANYTLNDKLVNVINKSKYLPLNAVKEKHAILWLADPESKEGKLKIQFNPLTSGDYWVVDTDYDNYAIVFSCSDQLLKASSLHYLWTLSRIPQPSADTLTKIDEALLKIKADKHYLRKTNNEAVACGFEVEENKEKTEEIEIITVTEDVK